MVYYTMFPEEVFPMGKKKHDPCGCSVIFDRMSYHYAWKDGGPIGVCKRFFRDLKNCRQRISRGYCDEDLFSIQDWFLSVVPAMLQQYKDTRHGSPGVLGENYTNKDGIAVNDTCHAEWDAILEKMIFLFREANEETCQRKNPYEDEHMRIFAEFTAKYGILGEKLETEEEKAFAAKTGGHTAHFASELPEYAEAEEKYMAAERELEEYREQCKDEAFELFSKWFYHLWD